MEVIGYLRDIPGTNFRCPGGSPKRACRSSLGGEAPASYEVTVTGENPSTVLAVEAVARGVTDEEAASFLGNVARLSLEGAALVDAQAWVQGNVSSGGELQAGDARAALYGAEGDRALGVVASGAPDLGPPAGGSAPKIDEDELLDEALGKAFGDALETTDAKGGP